MRASPTTRSTRTPAAPTWRTSVHEVPTIHPYLAIAPRGTPGHSREFAAHAGGADGDRMLRDRDPHPRRDRRRADPQPGLGRSAPGASCARSAGDGRSRRAERHPRRPGSDEALLAEIYDLEHDAITEDLAFYREWARRTPRRDDRPRLRVGSSVRGPAAWRRPRRSSASMARRRCWTAPLARIGADERLTTARDDGPHRARARATCGRSAAAIGSGWRSWPACSRTSTARRMRCARSSARDGCSSRRAAHRRHAGAERRCRRTTFRCRIDWERPLGDRRVVRRSRLRARARRRKGSAWSTPRSRT